MKPLNLDNRPCSPISSNCVIWQGPDIPCIKLCTGDTVSDVVFKLATELCTIMDTLNVTNYDLSCFNLTACPPEDFQALIQLLINKICELEGITPGGNDTKSTCPSCVITVASCFVQDNQTTMELVDYVIMIGEKICDIITQITELQDQINDLDVRVTILENTPPPVTPTPTIIVGCNIGTLVSGNSYTIDVVLDQLINSVANGYCSLLSVLGTPAQISNSLVPDCTFGTDVTTDPNWTAVPTTLAQSLTNAWIVLCDLYSIVSSGVFTTTDTNTINLNFTSGVLTANIQDTGWVNLNGFEWYGPYNETAKRIPQCRRIGNIIHFRGILMIPLQDPFNGNQPLIWDYNGNSPLTDTYYSNTTVMPSIVGSGSVVLNPGGSLTFNQGNSVIPTSVLPVGQNFDNTYSFGYKLALRLVKINATPNNFSGCLNTLLRPIITSDKKLLLQLVKDFEESAGIGTTTGNPYSTSIANNLISHVRAGEYVPKYQNSGSIMASSPYSGTVNTIALPAPLAPDTQYVNNSQLYYDPALTYPFSCDANDQEQIGGFGWVDLDGMSAFISPCATTIPTPTPCSIPA